MRISRRRLLLAGRLVMIGLPLLLLASALPLMASSRAPGLSWAILAAIAVGWVCFWLWAVGYSVTSVVYLAAGVYVSLLFVQSALVSPTVRLLALGATLLGALLPLRQGLLAVVAVSSLELAVAYIRKEALVLGLAAMFNDVLAGLFTVVVRQGILSYLELEAAREEIVRLARHERALAVLQERLRLSRELHDSISQTLNAMVLAADAARQQAATGAVPPPVKAFFEFVAAQGRTAAEDMRALIFDLRPELLERKGLMTALDQHAAALKTRHELSIQLAHSPEPSVPLEVKEALYRIAQEGLNNAARHAAAQKVTLSIQSEAEEVVLRIADDGIGFDPDVPVAGHLGIRSMQERAASLGGSLEVRSSPGSGTEVTARIPSSGERSG